jgi:hypothetical protein
MWHVVLGIYDHGSRWKGTHMKMRLKVVAWLCIFSTLLIGCYSSALIDPNGTERKKVYKGEIEYVIMLDGTKQIFSTPPTVKDSVILFNQPVAIAMRDVARFGSRNGGEEVHSVLTKDGTRYEFATPPRFSSDSLFGVASNRPVSISLSQVKFVSVTKLSEGNTALFSIGLIYAAGLAFAGLICLVITS